MITTMHGKGGRRWTARGAVAVLAATLALGGMGGCATTPGLKPEEAIARAAARAGGVEATVWMTVKNVNDGVGREKGGFYLNSFPNYRDSRSLNVIVSARAARELAEQGVIDPQAAYLNQSILVRGVVRKKLIYLVDANGRRTGEYYYQTQLPVWTARQIERADSGRRPEAAPVMDVAKAKTEDYLAADPENPIRALYMEALQRRIDELFQGEIFAGVFGENMRLTNGSTVRLRLVVLPDGRIATDGDSLKALLKQEPELAKVAVRVLMRITEKPTAFPDELRVSNPEGITHEVTFNIR